MGIARIGARVSLPSTSTGIPGSSFASHTLYMIGGVNLMVNSMIDLHFSAVNQWIDDEPLVGDGQDRTILYFEFGLRESMEHAYSAVVLSIVIFGFGFVLAAGKWYE